MAAISKRLILERSKIDKTKLYSFDDAITLVQQTSSAKFDESIEAHISLNIDPKYADQQLRTTVVLPFGTGRNIKIGVLTNFDNLKQAADSGADIYGSEDLIDEISKGILNFDILIATPDMMPRLAKLGRILGPKGLMPSPKAGTVSTSLSETVQEFKKGKLEYRADKTGIVHITFGKKSFSPNQLETNLKTFFQSVEQNKPSGVKGKYIKRLSLCSTMGPSVFVDFSTII